MQNRPPFIVSLESTKLPNQKYKFWDTSIAGIQRQPKNLSLVSASLQASQEFGKQPIHTNIESKLSEEQDITSNLSDQEDKGEQSETQEKIKSLEQKIQELHAKLEQSRLLNQNLVKQLNKTTNQLRVSEGLNQQLNIQCDKLYQNVKQTHDRHSEVQNEKMQLIIQISTMNQQKQLAINKSQIFEQQVQYLNKKIQSLNQQNSFQRSIANDLKKQTLMLKQQLNKMLTMMQDYSELQGEVGRTHSINSQIQGRVIKLQQQLKQTRMKVQQSELNEEKYMQEQNKLFLRLQELQNENKILRERLNFVQHELIMKSQQYMNYQSKQTDYESRYVKILQQLEKRNQDLVFELLAINQRNHKLVDERDFYMRRVEMANNNQITERLPYDQFLSILQATDSQVQNLKRRLQLKQDQMQQLNIKYEQQTLNLQQKIGELSNLVQIRDRQFGNREQIIQNEVRIHKKQYQLMVKRNQQLKNNQVKLRLQIIDKDRIIMDFVEKAKLEQSRVKKTTA